MNLKDDELKRVYPFKSNYLQINGINYHYVDEGENSRSGEAVLMLHGNPTWSFYYKDLILALKDRYRVIVPDHIGCGLSDKPQDYDYTLEKHISNLELLADKLGLKNITLAMHDWGGAIGMGFAVNNPDIVKRFIVFNTAAFLIKRLPLRIAIFRLPIIGTIGIRCFNLFARPAVYMASRRKDKMTADVKAGLLAPYDSFKNRIANLKFVHDIPLTKKDRCYGLVKSIQERLGIFKDRPMLILWGEKDFCFTKIFLDKWREYFPSADVRTFKDAGHYVVIDASDEIVPIIRDFLKRAD
jgi:haloalkane dehalogenase